MFKRVNITLSDDVLARADEFAARERYTRSGLIAAALDAFVGGAGDRASVAEETRATYGATLEAESPRGVSPAEPRADLSLERIGPLVRAYFEGRGDVEAAWVFGSVAHGTAGPMSDVDVAVLPKEGLEAAAVWSMRLDAMSRLPRVLGVREVDVVSLRDVSVALAFEVVSTGGLVFGEGHRETDEAIILALTSYWEFEDVRRVAREAMAERMRGYAASE